MNLQAEIIEREIRNTISEISVSYSADFTYQISAVLLSRQAYIRADAYSEGNVTRIHEYVSIVIDKFLEDQAYVYSVQVERDEAVWEPLYRRLIHYAYRFLLHKNFDASIQTHEIAVTCAAKAAEAILISRYPYDVDFERWANRIVQNQCNRYMRTEMRKSEVPSEKLVELNDEIDSFKSFDAPENSLEEKGLLEAIEKAIELLAKPRQEVIRLKYFEELTPLQIADRLGKSVDAVYCLHFNAIQDLRKILSSSGI